MSKEKKKLLEVVRDIECTQTLIEIFHVSLVHVEDTANKTRLVKAKYMGPTLRATSTFDVVFSEIQVVGQFGYF